MGGEDSRIGVRRCWGPKGFELCVCFIVGFAHEDLGLSVLWCSGGGCLSRDWVNCHVFEFFLGHTFNFDWCRLALFSFSIAREVLLVPEIETYTSDVR